MPCGTTAHAGDTHVVARCSTAQVPSASARHDRMRKTRAWSHIARWATARLLPALRALGRAASLAAIVGGTTPRGQTAAAAGRLLADAPVVDRAAGRLCAWAPPQPRPRPTRDTLAAGRDFTWPRPRPRPRTSGTLAAGRDFTWPRPRPRPRTSGTLAAGRDITMLAHAAGRCFTCPHACCKRCNDSCRVVPCAVDSRSPSGSTAATSCRGGAAMVSGAVSACFSAAAIGRADPDLAAAGGACGCRAASAGSASCCSRVPPSCPAAQLG